MGFKWVSRKKDAILIAAKSRCEVDRRKSMLRKELKMEAEDMSKVLDASAIGCLMYEMVCTKLVLAHVVSTISRYMTNLGKEHWSVMSGYSYTWKVLQNMGFCLRGNRVIIHW